MCLQPLFTPAVKFAYCSKSTTLALTVGFSFNASGSDTEVPYIEPKAQVSRKKCIPQCLMCTVVHWIGYTTYSLSYHNVNVTFAWYTLLPSLTLRESVHGGRTTALLEKMPLSHSIRNKYVCYHNSCAGDTNPKVKLKILKFSSLSFFLSFGFIY